jgi:hypothetical protein
MGAGAWVTVPTVAIGCLLAGLGLGAGGLSGRRLLRHALAFGPGLGLGLASLLLFFWRLLGLDRPGPLVFLMAGAVLAGGTAAWGARWGRRGEPARPAAPAPMALRALAGMALLASALGIAASFQAFSRAWPEGTWDAVAIWNVRARFLFRAWGEAPELLKQVDPTSHPHYPLLLPGAVAAQASAAGGESPAIAGATALAFLVGLGLLTFAVVADSGLPALGAAAAALVWGTPMVAKWGLAQVADVPLAYYFLGAVAALAGNLPGRQAARLPPLLAGLFLGLLAWTKNEGVLMALLVAGLYAVWTLRRASTGGEIGGRTHWRALAAVALGLAPGLAAALLFKRLWAPESGLTTFMQGQIWERILSLERWWAPVRETLLRLFPLAGTHGWDLAWPALVAGVCLAVAVHLRQRRTLGHEPWASFWGAAILATMASWIPIFVVTPYEQMWHISGSLDRLLLQVYPVTVAGVFLRLSAAVADVRLPPGSRP